MLGDNVLSGQDNNPARKIMDVANIFPYPDYNPPSLYDDLALVKLVSDVPLSRSILPACLPQPQYMLDRKKTVTVTGFGQLGAVGINTFMN